MLNHVPDMREAVHAARLPVDGLVFPPLRLLRRLLLAPAAAAMRAVLSVLLQMRPRRRRVLLLRSQEGQVVVLVPADAPSAEGSAVVSSLSVCRRVQRIDGSLSLHIEQLNEPLVRDLAIRLGRQRGDLFPIHFGLKPQRDPALTSGIRRGEKPGVLKQFILSVEADLQAQRRRAVPLDADSGEEFLGRERSDGPRPRLPSPPAATSRSGGCGRRVFEFGVWSS